MSQIADYIINKQEMFDDSDYDFEMPSVDHQELCPECGEMADIYIMGNGPDDSVSELRCNNCGFVIQD